ncbi:MAG: hypothetical protein M3143_00275, partial [Actinomycetota bacterium]|nr:hypothetical protein [Actinomycetota bacterium]
ARQLAKAYVAARTEMTKLRQKDTERTDRCRTELQQRLFGNPKAGTRLPSSLSETQPIEPTN